MIFVFTFTFFRLYLCHLCTCPIIYHLSLIFYLLTKSGHHSLSLSLSLTHIFFSLFLIFWFTLREKKIIVPFVCFKSFTLTCTCWLSYLAISRRAFSFFKKWQLLFKSEIKKREIKANSRFKLIMDKWDEVKVKAELN